MFNMQIFYTDTTKTLLEAVKETGLPIIVESVTDPDPQFLGEYFSKNHDYGLINGVDDLDIVGEAELITMYENLRKARGTKVVLVKRKQSVKLLLTVGDHIKIKAFRDASGNRFMHIIPVVKTIEDPRNILGEDNPLVLVIGEDSESFESNICHPDKSFTLNLETEEDVKQHALKIMDAILSMSEIVGVKRYLDIKGVKPYVFKVNLNNLNTEGAYDVLTRISRYSEKFGIYVQGHISHIEDLPEHYRNLFSKHIYL